MARDVIEIVSCSFLLVRGGNTEDLLSKHAINGILNSELSFSYTDPK
jgi:hypothetical protein